MPIAVSNPIPSRCNAAETLTGSAELSDDPDPPRKLPRKLPRKSPRKFGKRVVSEVSPSSLKPQASSPPLTISLNLQAKDADPPLSGWLEDQLRGAAVAAGVESGRINVMIVDDAAMTELHERYADSTGTTDVLSFDLRESDTDMLEADIVVCLDVASRQAEARGHDARLEALLYSVHGLLHLLGEDDHDAEGYDRMHRREDELLAAIGLGPVFFRSTKTR